MFDRLRLLPDDGYGYSVKKSGRRASRVQIMTPLECLARLCALVPAHYCPLTRNHGVIAPCARLRQTIVPQPPRDVRPSCSAKRRNVAAGDSKNRDAPVSLFVCARQQAVLSVIAPADARYRGEAHAATCSWSQARALGCIGQREELAACAHGQALLQLHGSPSPHASSRTHTTAHRPIGACVIAALLSAAAEAVDAHNVLSLSDWNRIGRGLPYAATSAVPWATLHARTFDQNVLLCERCSGRLRVRAVVVDLEVAGQILKSFSRHAGESGAVVRGPPSEQVDAGW